ncbi:hypothetical protein [Paenibacillus wenxiniae]|uniref:Uncharacterized protein n=1 Tax=Paenibacillus wenxiniae TaxID=1636843 RepID=A0ABW4RL72_9BACL
MSGLAQACRYPSELHSMVSCCLPSVTGMGVAADRTFLAQAA